MTLAADETPAPELALIVAVVLLAAVWTLASGVQRGLGRTAADPLVVGLLGRVVRVVGVIAAVLLALSISGVPVLTAVATLGLAGLAVALALQGILENFIAGVIRLIRRPLRAGEQVRTGQHEGTVLDIDLRVTKLVTYDGELVLVRNAEVFKNTTTNFIRRGRRRTHARIAVDYRDDHDLARDSGLTIPWPIRTLVVDGPVQADHSKP